jgi:hypothetical protein
MKYVFLAICGGLFRFGRAASRRRTRGAPRARVELFGAVGASHQRARRASHLPKRAAPTISHALAGAMRPRLREG